MRVQKGEPFLVFGDGRITACKPISDQDLARYLANCLEDGRLQNAILPVGGPGPAMTPIEQGQALFKPLGMAPKFRHVLVRLLDVIIFGLSTLGLKDKAEMTRIGRYYATESMLVWKAAANCYAEDAAPSFGADTLKDFHAKLIRGEANVDLREHSVF